MTKPKQNHSQQNGEHHTSREGMNNSADIHNREEELEKRMRDCRTEGCNHITEMCPVCLSAYTELKGIRQGRAQEQERIDSLAKNVKIRTCISYPTMLQHHYISERDFKELISKIKEIAKK